MPSRASRRRQNGSWQAREAEKKAKQKASWEALQASVAAKYN